MRIWSNNAPRAPGAHVESEPQGKRERERTQQIEPTTHVPICTNCFQYYVFMLVCLFTPVIYLCVFWHDGSTQLRGSGRILEDNPTDPADPSDPSDPTDPTDPTDPAPAQCVDCWCIQGDRSDSSRLDRIFVVLQRVPTLSSGLHHPSKGGRAESRECVCYMTLLLNKAT